LKVQNRRTVRVSRWNAHNALAYQRGIPSSEPRSLARIYTARPLGKTKTVFKDNARFSRTGKGSEIAAPGPVESVKIRCKPLSDKGIRLQEGHCNEWVCRRMSGEMQNLKISHQAKTAYGDFRRRWGCVTAYMARSWNAKGVIGNGGSGDKGALSSLSFGEGKASRLTGGGLRVILKSAACTGGE
jgi:hypothetical protein